ncbi:stressosome-associated protein Prli42 [Paenibacillus athensensis]|nr:stressosome-associated protein Prli42 [Paenibacillus athensensis]MCD1260717.1 stressosome-associated protein Prli42 [Paenibacillus athensensis]
MYNNKLWFKLVIYIMLLAIVASTILFTVSLFQ